MGLDTTHDCWHGPYSAFTRWRQQVGEAAGYRYVPLKDPGWTHFLVPDIDDALFAREHTMGEWSEPPSDVLLVLLVHSDCDGEIPHYWTKRLADRLTELLPKLPADPFARTERFIAGLLDAHAKGDAVGFH